MLYGMRGGRPGRGPVGGVARPRGTRVRRWNASGARREGRVTATWRERVPSTPPAGSRPRSAGHPRGTEPDRGGSVGEWDRTEGDFGSAGGDSAVRARDA